MEQINYDLWIQNERENLYQKERKNIFLKMYQKHFNNKCLCVKKNKKCINLTEVFLSDNGGTLSSCYDTGVLDKLYNINQSITQTLRSTTGTNFEQIIERIFKRENIRYSSQVKLKCGHIVDFTIPNYTDNFVGVVISCKTSLRERYLQDKYLSNVVILTMDQSTKDNVISVNPNKQYFTKWLNQIKKCNKINMNVLDLFCGCGGFSQGFKQAGFNIVAGIDNWKPAIDTYSSNHDHLSICEDLTVYSPEKLEQEHNIKVGDVDIIIGGPPCQGFSNAGKRDTKDPRNSLFMEFKKYLDYYKPKLFVMENVIGILSMKTVSGEKCIDIIHPILSEDYDILISKLYASDFNVPQNRRRVLIFGSRKDLNIKLTAPQPLYTIDKRPPVRTVLEQKENIDVKYFLSERAINGIKKKKKRMAEEGKGFGAQFLDLDKPSFTIPSRYWKDGYDALVRYSEECIRRLTPSELARIQTFPLSYNFKGTKKDIIIQIGNAVACTFAYEIAKHIQNLLFDKVPENEFDKMTVVQLKKLCKDKGLRGYSRLKRQEVIELLAD